MNTSDIKVLLEDFYSGETNAAQDRVLLEYFNGGDVAEELADEKLIFLSMYQAAPIDVPLSLESKLNKLIDELSDKEAKKDIRSIHRKRYIYTWIGSAAAGIAILVSVGLLSRHNENTATKDLLTAQQQTELIGTISEADKQTIKEAEEALVLLSSKFNKGVDQLATLSTGINKTNQILNKVFNRKTKQS